MPATDPTVQRSFAEQALRLAYATLDLLFPPRCVACGRVGTYLCGSCVGAFEPVGSLICPVCGEIQAAASLCSRCAAERRAFQSVRSAFQFTGGVRKAIHALKYEGKRVLAEPLAAAMAEVLAQPSASAAWLGAVPLHAGRKAERGYNQSELLAASLGDLWGIPVLRPEALVRTRDTAAQVGLDYAARQENVGGAFAARSSAVGGCDILLIDDVCTTGATLHACSEALLVAGAVSVRALTLARAM